MLTKTIEYVDYNGTKRKEDYQFNLSKAEVLEWVSSSDGDYTIDEYLKRIHETGNRKEMVSTFKDIIYRSYGRKSLDGKRFEKSEEIKKEFMESEAYSVLFMELAGDAKKASEFINGIIPDDLGNEILKIVQENPDGIPAEVRDYLTEGTVNAGN